MPKREKNNRDHVVTFRIDDGARGRLATELRQPVSGVRSIHQLARKVVIDFLSGKLVYTRQGDRGSDPAVAASRDHLALARASEG